MNNNDSLKNISQAILDFSETNEIVGFEKYVLDTLKDSNDVELFNSIWSTTIDFDNWNYSNLQIGFDKTMEILKTKYNLDEQVRIFLTNRAAYEWK